MSKLRDALTASDDKIKKTAADARIKMVVRKAEAALNATRDEVESARAATDAALVNPSFSIDAVLSGLERETAGLTRISSIKAFQEEFLNGETVVNAEDVKKK